MTACLQAYDEFWSNVQKTDESKRTMTMMSPYFDEFVKSLKDCQKASERGVLQAHFPYVVALGKSGKCKSKKAEIIKYFDQAIENKQTETEGPLGKTVHDDNAFCNTRESQKSK